jgi:hypothetical protein
MHPAGPFLQVHLHRRLARQSSANLPPAGTHLPAGARTPTSSGRTAERRDKGLDEACANRWPVVSMKRGWKAVFPPAR